MVKKTTNEHGTIDYPTVVIDGKEMAGLRKLAIEEKQERASLNVDIALLEQQAVDSGFFNDTDTPEDIQEEYYQEEDEPTPEPKNVTDSIKEDLSKTSDKEPEQKKASKETGTALF